MNEDLHNFPSFAAGAFAGLAKAAMTDPEVLVLFTSGLLLTSRPRPLRGLGIALAGWYATRRADQYMTVVNSNLSLLAHVIREGESQGG